MNQYQFSFPDEVAAIKYLEKYRGVDQDGKDIWLTGSHEHALAVLGDLYILPDTLKYGDQDYDALDAKTQAAATIARAEIAAKPGLAKDKPPPMVKSDGYHVNLIAEEITPELEQFLTFPKFPKNVWA